MRYSMSTMKPSSALEALLFVSAESVSKKKLAALLGCDEATLTSIAETLRDTLVGHGLALIETDDSFELRTAPEAAEVVKKLREGELSRDLGKAGLETLAIIMYRKSATRSEIDWVRGVNSAQTVRSLMMRGLIDRVEDESDKRKFRYRATTDALAHLGVTRLEELPRFDELSQHTQAAVAQTEDTTK